MPKPSAAPSSYVDLRRRRPLRSPLMAVTALSAHRYSRGVGMGFLKRRAPQQSGAPVPMSNSPWSLPEAPGKLYMPDALPSTDSVRISSFEWLEREMAARTINVALEQASMILRGHPNEDQINGVGHRLATHVQTALGPAGLRPGVFEDLFYSVWLGAGFGFLEKASGRQRPALVHPAIWNGLVRSGPSPVLTHPRRPTPAGSRSAAGRTPSASLERPRQRLASQPRAPPFGSLPCGYGGKDVHAS